MYCSGVPPQLAPVFGKPRSTIKNTRVIKDEITVELLKLEGGNCLLLPPVGKLYRATMGTALRRQVAW